MPAVVECPPTLLLLLPLLLVRCGDAPSACVHQGAPLAAVLAPLLSVTAIALVALACVAAAWRCGLAGLVQRISVEAKKKTPPGTAAKDITLVLTDVQVCMCA